MKSGADKFELLMRYLDGKLSGDELRAVNALLRTDADARQWLREISHQAFALGDIARERTVEGKPATVATAPLQDWWRPLAWAAAAVALFAAGLFGWSQLGAQPVVTLTEVSGSVIWSGDKGATRTELAAGARLPAGTVETIGAVSSAQLRFSDGTLLTLGGNSELTFAVTGQKRIQLKSGSLTAAVTKQPAGHPMLVRTPTAEVEVLGTLFAISTEPEATQLDVASGSVRLRRLVDGRAVEVTAQHNAVASLDAQAPLIAGAPTMPPTHWSADLAMPPTGGAKGDWHAAGDGAPARWQGVPLVMGRRQGAPVIHHGISVRDHARPSAGAFVTLASESALTLRWRTQKPAGLFIFVSTQLPGGAFGGNFELKPTKTAGALDADGWQTATFPLRSFQPLQSNHAEFSGHGISVAIVTTYERDVQLEVTDMSIGALPP